jgi:hypothetical protein
MVNENKDRQNTLTFHLINQLEIRTPNDGTSLPKHSTIEHLFLPEQAL